MTKFSLVPFFYENKSTVRQEKSNVPRGPQLKKFMWENTAKATEVPKKKKRAMTESAYFLNRSVLDKRS